MNVPFKFENTTREKAVPGSRKIMIILSVESKTPIFILLVPRA